MVYGSDNHMFVVIHNNLTSKPHKTCLSAYPAATPKPPQRGSQEPPDPATPYPPIQPKALNPYQAWLCGVKVKWLVLLAVAPFTLLYVLLEVLFHQLGWELWKFDSLLVNEAEAISTNAWRCVLASWPA